MSPIVNNISGNWSLIKPFERAEFKTIADLGPGEIESDVCQDFVHKVKWDGDPPQIVRLTHTEIQLLREDPSAFRSNHKEIYKEKCFLWAITEDSLIIVREKIRNSKRAHDPEYICHTNLTGAASAYIAGEILFGEDEAVYINNFSDRYGGKRTPPELWKATKIVFKEMGYTNCVDILELIYGTNFS